MNDICRTQDRQAMALARTNDPQTSKDAAKKMVDSGELSRQEKMIYWAIQGYCKNFGDFTTKDIAHNLVLTNRIPYHKAYDICRKRFSGLENKGKIVAIWTNDKPWPKKLRRDGCRVWRLF